MEKLKHDDEVVVNTAPEPEVSRRETRYPAVLCGGFGSSAVNAYGNGGTVSVANGLVRVKMPDGKITTSRGNGWSTKKKFYGDGRTDYHLEITVNPTCRVITANDSHLAEFLEKCNQDFDTAYDCWYLQGNLRRRFGEGFKNAPLDELIDKVGLQDIYSVAGEYGLSQDDIRNVLTAVCFERQKLSPSL